MGFTVEFFNFTKKPNITKRPIGAGFEYDCIMKEKTSIINPVLTISTKTPNGIDINPIIWNYCFIPDFRRYYFITNVVANFNLWDVYLTVDVLASFQQDIEAEEAYITRSEKLRDQFLSDSIFPAKVCVSEAVIPLDTYNTDIQSSSSNGSFIVGVINPQANNKAVSYYVMTSAEFNELKNQLFSIENFRNLNDIEISDDLLKVLFNPFQYIASVMYLPISPSIIAPSASSVSIDFGWWDSTGTGISATGKLITSDVIGPVNCGSFTVYRHQEAGALDQNPLNSDLGIAPFDGLGQYLNYAPYTHYYMRFEPFGFFELDNTVMGNALSSYEANNNDGFIEISLTLSIDTITGKGYLYFNFSDGLDTFYRLTPKEAIVGVPIQIGQITSDVVGGALSAARGVANATGSFNLLNPIGSAMQGAVSIAAGVYDGLQIAAPKLQTSGTQGGFSSFHEKSYMIERFQIVTEHAPEEIGYPLMRTLKIEDCKPGFVKTLYTDIQIHNALEEERNRIAQLLNNGIHLEDDSE